MDYHRLIRRIFSIVIGMSLLGSLSCVRPKQSQATVQTDSTHSTGRIYPVDSIRSLDKNGLSEIYGAPVSCDTFLLNSGASEFSIELYNIFPPEYLETHEVYIDESTWSVDSANNLTVWYRLENGILHPVDSCLWSKDLEF